MTGDVADGFVRYLFIEVPSVRRDMGIVLHQVRMLLQTPEVIVQTWRGAREQQIEVNENDVRTALMEFSDLWKELFPVEQARIVELLVKRVELRPDHIDITIKIEGLTSLCNELRSQPLMQQAAE